MDDRKAIQRRIFDLRKAINVELGFGSPERANQLLDEISALEAQLVTERERKAAKEMK